MDRTFGNIIIAESMCGGSSIHTVTAHHRRYPEIAAEAGSAARAVEYLERLLMRALDFDAEQWRREALQQAVTDVRRCASTLPAASSFSAARSEDPERRAAVRPD